MSATVIKFPGTPSSSHSSTPDNPPPANISERQSRRMSMWLIDCERYLGLTLTRSMLIAALDWVDGRLQFKRS